ncbi:hypothetical protein BC940DRAFT_299410 [Gongronella butleri]|nr:hypothetical protein BC940DRAFT_299410 [Gongronella butleri]
MIPSVLFTSWLKRQRFKTLQKIVAVLLLLSLTVVFWQAQQDLSSGADATDPEAAMAPGYYSHERYHLESHEHDNDDIFVNVQIPRHALADSLAKARQSRLEREQAFLGMQPQEDNDSLTAAEGTMDAVFRLPEDDHGLPPGNGRDKDEKFISYIPHSGFHNQRISMINALMLAEQLNRTLLVPPVILGEPIHWRKHDSLESFHRRQSKARLAAHCKQQQQNASNNHQNDGISAECAASFRYTSLRWDRLFDLSAIKERVRIRYRDEYTKAYLHDQFAIDARNTFYIKDTALYDYRIVQDGSPKMTAPNRKYTRTIPLSDLAARKERLLSFGSLFGHGRVVTIDQKKQIDFFNRQFLFDRNALPGVFDELDRVMGLLGGPQSYIAVHARVGDSIFIRYADEVMGKLWKDLQVYRPVLDAEMEENDNNDHENDNGNDDEGHWQQKVVDKEPEATCYDHKNAPYSQLAPAIDWNTSKVRGDRPLVMYMATDAADPRTDDRLARIFGNFPCIVLLKDVFDFDQSPLASMINPEDGVNYGRFLVPFLDGLIASRAQNFTGSPRSTFSTYIRFMHSVVAP